MCTNMLLHQTDREQVRQLGMQRQADCRVAAVLQHNGGTHLRHRIAYPKAKRILSNVLVQWDMGGLWEAHHSAS